MKFDLHAINAFVIDGMSTVMLILFAVEATARVYAMTLSAIRRALRTEGEK